MKRLACLLALCPAAVLHAQPTDVMIMHFAFDPPDLTIEVGETVRWTNHEFLPHTVTSQTGSGTGIPSGVFGSPTLGRNQSFQFTFNVAPGDYHYFCLIHGVSMQAVVRVVSPPCEADLSGSSDPNDPAYGNPDGVADAADFFYYLDQFAAGNIAVADISGSSDPNDSAYGVPDGVLDAADFFYYLDLFVAGCP